MRELIKTAAQPSFSFSFLSFFLLSISVPFSFLLSMLRFAAYVIDEKVALCVVVTANLCFLTGLGERVGDLMMSQFSGMKSWC